MCLLRCVLCDAVAAQARESLLVEAAQSALAEQYPGHEERMEIRLVRTGGDAPADAPLRVRLPAGAGVPKGRIQANLQALSPDGAWQDAGWAQFYVAHFDSVAVPTRALNKDAEIGPDDLVFAWMETTRFAGDPLTPALLRDLATAPLFAHRHLQADRALQRTDVRPAYAADTGEPLDMIYQRDQLTLIVKGQARSPGFVGDIIRFYAPTTKSMYKVRLTGPGAAEWLETLD
ncbi:MAG: flagella basal body P-ring formation protein FlgA [Rhodothermales bacterium]